MFDIFVKITALQDKIFDRVYDNGNNEIIFENQNETYKMYHSQNCCEHVYIESLVGDLSDLAGVPLLMAEEVEGYSNPDETEPEDDDYDSLVKWTFYKFGTIKGYVDIRWYGSSNGYYGVGVHIEKVK